MAGAGFAAAGLLIGGGGLVLLIRPRVGLWITVAGLSLPVILCQRHIVWRSFPPDYGWYVSLAWNADVWIPSAGSLGLIIFRRRCA